MSPLTVGATEDRDVVDFFQSVKSARIQRAGLVSDAVCHVTLSAPT